MGGVAVLLAFFTAVTLRNLFMCCYITITDNEIMFINPFFRTCRQFRFSDIAYIRMYIRGEVFLRIRDRNGRRTFKGIELVDRNDLKEIVGILEAHGIEVGKDIWKGYFE